MFSHLKNLIQTKKAKVAVIGLGYVGMPLAQAVHRADFKVIGIDLSPVKADFTTSQNYELIRQADIICICLPTPLTKHKTPDLSYLEKARDEILTRFKPGKLIILESTSYPGTTEELFVEPLKKLGFKPGIDFFLASSPERIDPGNPDFHLVNTPKLVGGLTKRCGQLACDFYASFIETIVPVSSPRTAEMAKLLENIFRIVNISLVNEMALLAEKMEIDIWEIIEAAKTKPHGFMAFYPGPGVGGHCIPVDPFYLSWKAREFNFFTRFIDLAGEINDLMPHFVITKIISALNSQAKAINGAKILVWGVAYKKDVADTRESPALRIIADLLRKHAKVSYFDPLVARFKFGAKILSAIKFNPANPASLKVFDCVVIITDHSGFDYNSLAKHVNLIVDTRNAIKDRQIKNIFRI